MMRLTWTVPLTITLLFCCVGPLAMAQEDLPLFDALFREHVVLQRGGPIPVWGTARPGETVTVALAGASASAEADGDGRWAADLPAVAAGGPYVLEARSADGRVQTVEDVLVGDVFLCSGQSNMVLPVSRALNTPTEVRNATDDRIRLMTVGLASNPTPLETLPTPGTWEVASPETVADWSAACYFFARELRQTVDVPLGLITSAWGGSNIRAWMNQAALSSTGYDEALGLLRLYAEDQAAAQQGFGETWETWWRDRSDDAAGTEPWQPATGAAWPLAPAVLGDWTAWDALQGFTGMVWFRAAAELTAEQAQQDAVLSLGAIDEVDQTWINGHVVGNTFGYGTERTYQVPASLLQEGENVIVVNVLNTYGAGGLVGDPARRALAFGDGSRVPLETWRYDPVRTVGGYPPRAPWESVAGFSTIHNAMTAPLRDYGLKAALWYQGESNTDEAGTYRDLLQALVAQWREQFGADLPVLVVQLANYGAPSTAPTESGWAEVREAQRLVAEGDSLVGLAVTIDIGDAYDIHPSNKQEVGRRLARTARRVVYGESSLSSGPAPAHAERHGDTVAVTFEGVEEGLVTYGHTGPIGFELCGADRGSCRYVDAQLDGERVLLQAPADLEVTRVRYAWADSPVVTLYDASGLPVGPFELPVEERP